MEHLDLIRRVDPAQELHKTVCLSVQGTVIEIIMTTLSNKHDIKLEINNNKISRKFPNI